MTQVEYFTTWSCPPRYRSLLAKLYSKNRPRRYFTRTIQELLLNFTIRHAVVAVVQRQIVGIWLFSFHDVYSRHLVSSYTKVARHVRHLNIATTMWRRGLRAWSPRTVEVAVASHGGAALLRKIIVEHPKIRFEIDEQRAHSPPFWEEFTYKLLGRS